MKKIFVILFAGLLVSAGLSAQRVCIEDGKVILDLTEATGMPAGAITDVSKTVMFNDLITQYGAPSSTSVLWRSENQTDRDINATVFQKLEVAPEDMDRKGVMRGQKGILQMDWPTAFNGCINSKYDGGGWRLPTQRELQMMWIFNDALKEAFAHPNVNGSNFLSDNYRSATETNDKFAWNVNFGEGGYTNSGIHKMIVLPVRCVREVTN
jgi:hypothetical protein